MKKLNKLRIVIQDIGLSGGLPKTKLYDLMDILEEKYYNKWFRRIELTPRILGKILNEFPNVKRWYGRTNNNRRLRPIHYTIHKSRKVKYEKKEIPPLISDGSLNMVHKCEWKNYFILPEGRFKKCKKCGLILRNEETEALDILVSKK